MMFFDAIHYPVRTEGLVKQRAVYIAIGIDLDGNRDVCGLWIGEAESSKYWLSLMNELKNRGVRAILLVSVDGLNGLNEAIHTVYPQADIQRCIVHQVRNSMRYVSSKDLKVYTTEMKKIYQAPTEEAGLMELDEFEEKWGKKYPTALRSWRETGWNSVPSLNTLRLFADLFIPQIESKILTVVYEKSQKQKPPILRIQPC